MTRALLKNAVSDAPNRKGGGAETTAAHIQDIAMLNVVEAEPQDNGFRTASPEGRATKWIDEQIALAAGKIGVGVVEITPAMARALLARNPGNRRVSEPTVSKIARDIEAGNFVVNGESIIVASDGSLNDGQHRLCAVVQTGMPIKSVVVFGPARDTRVTVDQGRSKMVGDYLAMEGHKDSLALAAAAGYAWQWQNIGRLSGQTNEKPNKGETIAFVDAHPNLSRSVSKVGGNGVAGRGLLAFCHWAFSVTASSTAADEFMEALITGANLLSKDPILYARNRLMADRRLSPNEKAKLIFRAWNAHRRGEQPRTLIVTDRSDALPMVEA